MEPHRRGRWNGLRSSRQPFSVRRAPAAGQQALATATVSKNRARHGAVQASLPTTATTFLDLPIRRRKSA
jgi:hypothetical protein